MPRTPHQNEALRATSRAKILEAALVLFARDGFADTTVRAIAQHAGVATGLLYSHFPGKEGVLHALFEQSMTQVQLSFSMAEAVPPRDRIAALVRASVQIVREHRAFWQLGYAARTQPAVIAALAPSLGSWTAAIVGTLRRYLADAGSADPDLDAWALFAQIDGMCQHFALAPHDYPIDAVAGRVIAQWAAP